MTTATFKPQLCCRCTKRLIDEWVTCACGVKLCGWTCFMEHRKDCVKSFMTGGVLQHPTQSPIATFACLVILALIGAVCILFMAWPVQR